MDFETPAGHEFDTANLQPSGSDAPPVAPRGPDRVLTANAQGVVVLPEGVSLEDIQVEGRNLVIVADDGTRYVIVDGAIIVPQLVAEGVAVPPVNLAALLVGNEPEPAAGNPQSSGNNFSRAVGPIQDAFDLGDLLPYTELQFAGPQDEEVIPDIVDRDPGTVIITPNNPAGAVNATASVNEAGLPARGQEPPGSNAASNSETTTGTIVYTAPDGLDTVSLNGVVITAVNQTIAGSFGTLTITSIAPGSIGYSYTLADNTLTAANEVYGVTVTEVDGDTATADLTITIIDDVPTARNDTDTVPASTYVGESGNVFTGVGTTSGAVGADTPGADGATVTGIVAGTGTTFAAPGGTINGQYGTLTINAAGGYTYTRTAGTPGGVNDVFTYRLTDGDGDTSTATLTIAITDAPATVTSVPTGQGGTVVNEAGLPTRPSETAGSDEQAASESTSGTITFTAPDGVGSVQINGTTVTGAGQVINLPNGTFTVDSYNPGAGTLTYTFTLTDNTSGNSTSTTVTVTVTDIDGDFDSEPFTITIIDDAPTARADVDGVGENGPLVADGNVITGSGGSDVNATDGVADTPGADGATVTGVAAGSNTANPVSGNVGSSVAGTYGSLVINADGTYTYTLNAQNPLVQALGNGDTANDVFVYTITDGDGDTSTTTVTVTVTGADSPVVITGLDGRGADEIVDEDDLSDGSSPDAAALTQTGTFSVDSADGLATLTVNGTAVFGAGVIYPVTIVTGYRTLTITGVTTTTNAGGEVVSATVSYTYVLNDNTLLHTGGNDGSLTESFSVVATDTDGSSDTDSLDITVIDDVPTANPDTNSVAEGGTANGNVLTDNDDVPGADGATVTGVATGSNTANPVAGNVGTQIQGTYGKLTLNANGTYTYDGDPNTVPQAGATDTFVYTITDGDGDTSTTTLTITLTDASFPVSDDDALVDEAGLAAGSNSASDSEIFNGAITPGGGVPGYTYTLTSSANGTYGNLVLNADGTYTYTLTTRYDTSPDNDNGTNTEDNKDSFTYTVTDANGNTSNGTILVDITDDVPTASSNTNSGVEGAVLTGNVLTDGTDDVFGADGAAAGGGVTGVATGSNTAVPVSGNVGSALQGTYGKLTLNADGTYSYDGDPNTVPPAGATETFVYTITDGDGDTSTTTLTITLTDGNFPVSDTDATVNEKGLAAGGSGENADSNAGNNSDTSETTTGAITPGGGTGPYTYTLTSSATGTFGTLTLNSDGTYSYTLTSRYDTNPDADNGTNTEQDRDTFNYTVTDANGNTTTGSILVDIVDDVPTASSNTNSVAEGAIVAGNVLTDGTDDVFGADGAAAGGGVTGVATGSNTAAPVSGNVGTQITGTYGKLTLNANGTYSYDADPNTITTGSVVDHFVYTITDGDGDTSTVTLDITINDVTLAGDNDTVTVNEAALDTSISGQDVAAGTVTGSSPGLTTETVTGTLVVAGAAANGFVAQDVTTAFGRFVLNTNGTYTYTLKSPATTTPSSNGANTIPGVESFTYTVADANGNSTTGTVTIDVVDDAPIARTDSDAATEGGSTTGNVLDGTSTTGGLNGPGADTAGADGYDAGGGVVGVRTPGGGNDTTTPVLTGAGTPIVGQYGTLTLNANGGYSYTANPNSVTTNGLSDTFVYTIRDGDGDLSTTTLVIFINNVTVTASDTDATVNEKGLAANGSGELADGNAGNNSDTSETTTGSITPSGGSGTYTYALTSPAVGTFGTLTLNADGTYSYTLTSRYDTNPDAANGTNTEQDRDTFNYTVTDSNGNSTTGSILVDIVDDVPTAVQPKATIMNNAIGATGGNYLDNDNDVDIDYGADTPGAAVIFDAATITSLQGQNLQSGFSPLNYAISGGGTVLTATKGSDGTTVFTITLQPVGSPDQYVVNISQKLDSTTTIDFNAGNYNFEGGNKVWNGFVPIAETLGTTIVDNASQDLLLTPEVNGVHDDTVNTTASIGGIGGGASVGSTETFRVDFVTDLRGDPADTGGGDYDTLSKRDHVFDGHYTVNGASALFKSATNATVKITAFDDPDGNNVVGDGAIDTITGVVITWRGGTASSLITTGGVYNVNGHNFTVAFNGDGSVSVAGVEGDSGSSMIGTVIAVYTANGYNSVEYAHAAGDTFQIGDFGATVQTTTPVVITVPTTIVDGDGDTATNSTFTITLNATTPPIALDLDGDGVEFVSAAAGNTFDYDGNGTAESTAWVGADDGLLAIDLNGNGTIDSGAELAFGSSSLTDLGGLAAKYDSNADGVLDANDAAFAQFGVLQDGQFTSLADAGIASINLSTDGVSYNAANDEVTVSGTGTFTRADGSTGSLADAAFATDRRTAETAVVTAAAGALVAPELAAASDAKVTADEPVARELSIASSAPQATMGDAADDTGANSAADLLDNSAAGAPAAEAASLHTEDAPDTAISSDLIDLGGDLAIAGSGGSEAVADFSLGAPGSSGGFGGGDDGALMDALLAINSPGALQTQDLAPVREALAEFTGTAAIDAIVDHFAGAAGGMAFGNLGSNMLLDALDASVFTGLGMHASDTIDDAAQLAAAVHA